MSSPPRRSQRNIAPTSVSASTASVRSTSRKTPGSAPKIAPRKKKVPVESVSDSSDSESEKDDDPEWSSSAPKKPQKRRKITLREHTPKQIKLNLLPTMPLDILFEVMGNLAPKDLFSLSQLNKMFRDMLCQSSGSTVWKQIRRHYSAPDPPPTMTEYRWARLLFGEPRCQKCDRKGITTIDWGMCKRVCNPCIRTNIMPNTDFAKYFEFHDESVLDIIPYSTTHHMSSARREHKRRRFYWRSDVEKALEVLARYKSDVSLRKAGARKNLEDFIEQRKGVVKAMREHIHKCDEWMCVMEQIKGSAKTEAVEARFQAIKKRFLEDPQYTAADLDSVRQTWDAVSLVSSGKPLTEHGWKYAKNALNHVVQRAKNRRLDADHPAVISSRTAVYHEALTNLKKSMKPAEWFYMPSFRSMERYECARNVIYSNPENDVTLESFEDAMECATSHIEASKQSVRTLILNDLGRHFPGHQFLPSHLPLAIAVFECTSCPTAGFFFGEEEVWRHVSTCPDHDDQLQFFIFKAGIVQAICALSGMDYLEATVADLDAKKVLFIYEEDGDGPEERKLYSWRECVIQSLSTSSLKEYKPAENETIREVYPEEHDEKESNWTCMHCSVHYEAWESKDTVTSHVQEAHDIAEPNVGEDLMLRPGVQYVHPSYEIVKEGTEKMDVDTL